MRVLVGTTGYAGSTAFYREVLEFPVQEEWDGSDGRGTLFDAGGGVIEVMEDSPHHPAEAPRGVRVSIEVGGVDRLHTRLAEAGVVPTDPLAHPPSGHRSLPISDPNR